MQLNITHIHNAIKIITFLKFFLNCIRYNTSYAFESAQMNFNNTLMRIYSFRFSQKYRGLALREEDCMRLLMLHTDHDSASL